MSIQNDNKTFTPINNVIEINNKVMENDENKSDIINRFIAEIRELSLLSDDQIRYLLRRIEKEKPEIFESIKQPAQRKILHDLKKMIKEMKEKELKGKKEITNVLN